MKMKKILITGGSGFLGSKLVEKLKDKYNIIIFNKSNNKDITKKEDFVGLEADYVIHLAALTRSQNNEDMFNINVNGTLNVLEFCKEKKAKFVFASSAAVYGDYKEAIKEDFLLKPKSFYGLTKVLGEKMCEFYNKNFNIPIVVLRIFNMYGPEQQKGFLIPDIVSQLKNEKIIIGNPYPKRDYVYVNDVVEAFVKGLELAGFNIINIGTGKSHSGKEVVEMLAKDKEIEFLDSIKIDSNSCADISKARELLNWKPKVFLEEGLRRVLGS